MFEAMLVFGIVVAVAWYIFNLGNENEPIFSGWLSQSSMKQVLNSSNPRSNYEVKKDDILWSSIESFVSIAPKNKI